MTIKGKAFIAGIYEHPTRKARLNRLHVNWILWTYWVVSYDCALKSLFLDQVWGFEIEP